MKTPLKKFQSVFIAFLFLCGTGSAVVWIWYSIDGFGDELYDRMQTIANQNAFDTQFSELQSVVTATEDERTMLEQFILRDENDTIELLSKFDDIAATHRVELETGRLEVVEGSGNFNTLALEYRLSGSETAVTKMITMFETMPYHNQIETLSIQRSTDTETGAQTLSATIGLLLSIKKYD